MEQDYIRPIEDIINRVRGVIGEPAVTQADSIGIVMEVSEENVEVKDFQGKGKNVISELYDAYRSIIGPPARLMCIRALEKHTESIDLPEVLK